jgi:N-acetyl-gamma-glutamyl-phosphate reductase
MASNKIRIVLVGGSGYAGFEAVRWLGRHPNAELVGVFGSSKNLVPLDELYPLLTKQVSMRQELFEIESVKKLSPELVILCVPHKVAMSYVPLLREAGIRCIDLSADYRIASAEIYEKWYCPHTDTEHLKEAVYGLPEFFSSEIRSANLVANPGCYPTCSVLPLAPVLKAGLIEPTGIVINAISGVSGAGRTPSQKFHFPDRNENFEPYGVGNHRHMPEIEQTLATIVGGAVEVLFQPHLSPMDRGMLCSIYARPAAGATAQKIMEALHAEYDSKPFVRVRDDVLPATKYVSYTNYCDVTATLAKGTVVLFSALDNLLKGASGQAIQNMNIMFGFEETTGLY